MGKATSRGDLARFPNSTPGRANSTPGRVPENKAPALDISSGAYKGQLNAGRRGNSSTYIYIL
jgi:hypothetical protein